MAWASFTTNRAFFDWWDQNGGPANPLARRKRPTAPDIHRRPFTLEELGRLRARLREAHIRDRAEVLLMIDQGFRVGSVANLTLDDVDFEGMRIRVKGKHRLDQWLPMKASVGAVLGEYVTWAGVTEGYVFSGRDGQLTTRAVRKAWERVRGEDLRHLCAHQCRNTFANSLIREGRR